jgi:hypothetical protein
MSIVLLGSTSGSCTLQEQAVAGTTTLTLPTFNGTVGLLVSGTAVASTSGTSIDFTSIPAGVRRITIMFSGVSTNGTSNPIIQLGDSGGIENTGYSATSFFIQNAGATGVVTSTAGYAIASGAAANSLIATFVINLIDASANRWVIAGSGTLESAATAFFTNGVKALSATLDRVRITTVNGTDTFDAGSINILYE